MTTYSKYSRNLPDGIHMLKFPYYLNRLRKTEIFHWYTQNEITILLIICQVNEYSGIVVY